MPRPSATRRYRRPARGLLIVVAVTVASGYSATDAVGQTARHQSSDQPAVQVHVCNMAYDTVPGSTISAFATPARQPNAVTIGSLPSAVASTPDGRRLLVTAQGDNILEILDTSDYAAVGQVTTGLEPDAVAVTPDGKTALVANLGDGTVTPVDLSTHQAGAPVGVGPGPTAVVFSPTSPSGGGAAWVAVGESLVPVSLSGRSPGAPVPVGHIVEAMALSDRGHSAWIATSDGAIASVDLSSGDLRGTTQVGGRPSAIAVAPPWP